METGKDPQKYTKALKELYDLLQSHAREKGFTDGKEVLRLVESVDVSIIEKKELLTVWGNEDGTKDGLLKLL